MKNISISLSLILLIVASGSVLAQPTFTATFNKDHIGPGNVSKLTFTITNASGSPITDIAFANNLPANLFIATPANTAISNFSGILTATDGGSSITFTDGSCGAGETITISVDVTSSLAGTYTNVTGDLTSSDGNSGTATDDLIVSLDRPGFSKSFSPSSINFEERTTLTFTIDNSANVNNIGTINFTDNLPLGMVIAEPANTSISFSSGPPFFDPVLTAVSGTNIITYLGNGLAAPGFAALPSGATCTISVDVTGNTVGSLINEVELIVNGMTSCGNASASLEVLTPDEIYIQKSFNPNPVVPGGTTNLEFTISNYTRNFEATDITFTDDLDAVLSGLVATGLPINDICGSGSQLTGTSMITLTGGSLAAEGSVTFSVPLQIPAGASPGTYLNTTSSITAEIDGSTITGNAANENLFISYAPILTKTFLDNPILSGQNTEIEFTITNTSSTSSLTDIAFTDNISAFLSGATIVSLPAANSCGPGSSFTQTINGDAITFNMINGSIAAGGSATFSLVIKAPDNTSGIFTNTTSRISAVLDAESLSGEPASDDLEILALPQLRISFTDDPVEPGNTATLEFKITYDEFATADATNINFTDDLDAVISGLVATGLPQNDVCGTGSALSGTSTISLTGGTMSPGDEYTFSATIDVPAGILPGSYTNTTSTLGATVGGLTGSSPAASDDLEIGGLTFTKEFIDDPVIPGDLVTLRFTIENNSTYNASNIVFTDNLTTTINGLVTEAPLPTQLCGSSSSVNGTNFLIYSGGEVAAGNSCSFDVMCRVPSSATSGDYSNTTSNLSATMNATAISIPAASDILEVNNNYIELTKTFTDDPVTPGDAVTLEYTLTNLHPSLALSDISFTDDLDAALSGLAAIGLPMNDICGAGSQISGTGLISLTGGSLAAGASSTFSITLQTPSSSPYGGSLSSTTSSLTGQINSLNVVGDAASDYLDFTSLQVSKSFSGNVLPGESVTLTYTLTNPDGVNSVSNIRFSDDLDTFISGATASNLPLSDVVGEGSTVSGSSFILLNDGILSPMESKSFDVTIEIPCATTPGTYSSVSSNITANGYNGTYELEPASADLTVYDDFTVGSISANQSLCYNTSPNELTGTAPTGSNTPYAYQWQSSIDNISFSDITDATDLNYQPGNLTQNTYYRLKQYSATGCDPLITDTVSITVYDEFSAGSISSDQTICYITTPDELEGTAPTGGSTSYEYQWQSSTDNINFSDITGATNLNYQPGALSTTTYYRQKQSSTADCGTATTNTVTIQVYEDFSAGSISENQNICYNTTPLELTGTAPTGGSSSYTYQWQNSTDNVSYFDISGATDLNYQPGALTATTYYRLKQISGSSCGTVNSNIVTISVYDEFSVGSISDDQMICNSGIPDELTGVSPSGGSTPYSYQWQISLNDQDFDDIPGANSLNYQPEEVSQTTYFRLVQSSSNSCGEETTNSVEIGIHYLCCSDAANSCQSPVIGDNDAYLSDVSSNQQVFDNYSGIVGTITHIEWWGSTVDGSGNYCDENPKDFVISFYSNNQGAVGDLISSYEISVTGTLAGANIDNNAPIMYYSYQLAPYLTLPYPEGWVSIQGNPAGSCEFAWVTSPNGDGISFIEGGSQKSQSAEDFAFGLTFTPDVPLNNWGIFIGLFLLTIFTLFVTFKKYY